MSVLVRVAACLVALVVAAGCAKTTVTERQYYTGQRIPRPDRIIVHDFAGSAADIPAGSTAQYQQLTTPPSAEETEIARKLGAEVAKDLVQEIQAMGLPAVRAAGQPPARPGDIVIMGYFVSIDEGSIAKRIALGFGAGSANLKTEVEGYLMTKEGLRRLGSGEVDAAGGKGPGVAIPLVVAAATDNPIGLIVSGAAKVEGQVSGRTTIEGSAKRTAKEIATQLRPAFQRQGWI